MNKKVVVTGGSRGIGKAIAEAFLKDGAEVMLIARNADELTGVQQEFSPFGKVHVQVADVSRTEDLERAAVEAKKVLGGVDVLVNAAGIYGPIGLVTEVDPTAWHEALDVNLFGTFAAVHYFAPLMKEHGGTIINFVGGGEGAYPNFSSYVAGKGGIARLTETVAAELKGDGIRVNAIAPGAVNTKFLDDIIAAGPEKSGKDTYERSLKQKESGGVSSEKAAALSLFLASDEAEGLSGKILSAVWDPYTTFPEHMAEIMSSDIYTVRRVTDRGEK